MNRPIDPQRLKALTGDRDAGAAQERPSLWERSLTWIVLGTAAGGYTVALIMFLQAHGILAQP